MSPPQNHIRNKIQSEIPLQNPISGLPANLREINTTKPQQAKKLLSAPNGTTTAQAKQAKQKQTQNQSNKQQM